MFHSGGFIVFHRLPSFPRDFDIAYAGINTFFAQVMQNSSIYPLCVIFKVNIWQILFRNSPEVLDVFPHCASQFIGQTSPCNLPFCSPLTTLKTSSTLLPTGKSLTENWRSFPSLSITKTARYSAFNSLRPSASIGYFWKCSE